MRHVRSDCLCHQLLDCTLGIPSALYNLSLPSDAFYLEKLRQGNLTVGIIRILLPLFVLSVFILHGGLGQTT